MKVLIVIDMQNDFIDGALGSKEAVAILPNVKKKIEANRRAGNTIIFTRDTHGPDYLKTMEGKKLPVPHCIKGTAGWKISDELDVSDSIVIDKPTFGSLQLVEELKTLSLEDSLEAIELVGLCTDICVISNAMLVKAAFHETAVIVDGSCCAGVSRESHDNALRAMAMCHIDTIF